MSNLDFLLLAVLGQARLDGAFCSYSENEKLNFFHKCHELGVRNIEMEAAGFASLVHRAGYKGTDRNEDPRYERVIHFFV